MSELLKKQNYGVEVEFTGISRKMAADAVAEIIGTAASRPDRTCYQTRTIQDSQGRKWKVMRDSSIHPIRKVGTENMDEYRVEFVTPVLKYEDLDTLQAIIRKFREIGGVPHSSCGIHIHVDGANHTATSLRRLVNFMYSRQEIIYDALAVGDRKYRWCQPVCKNLLDTMKKDKNITTDSVEKIWYSPANDGYCGGIDHQHYKEDMIIKNEEDYLEGLLAAADDAANDIKKIDIIRNERKYFSFRIHSLSDEMLKDIRKKYTKYTKNRRQGIRVADELDLPKYRASLIYNSTTEEDQAKLWDNPAVKKGLEAKGICIINALDVIDAVLLPGEKDRICDMRNDVPDDLVWNSIL